MKQLIYKQKIKKRFDIPDMAGYQFVECCSLLDGIKNFGILIRHLGVIGFLKDLLKLGTSKRLYFCITDDQKIVSEAYVTVGMCRHYKVENNAAVLGPVWTDGETRGKGLATDLLKRTINTLILRQYNLLYIDTSENNIAMQNVIQKCGFGDAIDEYEK